MAGARPRRAGRRHPDAGSAARTRPCRSCGGRSGRLTGGGRLVCLPRTGRRESQIRPYRSPAPPTSIVRRHRARRPRRFHVETSAPSGNGSSASCQPRRALYVAADLTTRPASARGSAESGPAGPRRSCAPTAARPDAASSLHGGRHAVCRAAPCARGVVQGLRLAMVRPGAMSGPAPEHGAGSVPPSKGKGRAEWRKIVMLTPRQP
jgi:hypothetical protein